MGEAVIALVAGVIGAMAGLSGTMLTLRNQRRIEREKWLRQEIVDRIGAFLAEINEIWRSLHAGGQPLASTDGPWVACANAYDRASLVVSEPRTTELLEDLWEVALEIRWAQPGDEIWDEKVWPLTHDLKAQVRTSLLDGSDSSHAIDRWRPPAFRSEEQARHRPHRPSATPGEET